MKRKAYCGKADIGVPTGGKSETAVTGGEDARNGSEMRRYGQCGAMAIKGTFERQAKRRRSRRRNKHGTVRVPQYAFRLLCNHLIYKVFAALPEELCLRKTFREAGIILFFVAKFPEAKAVLFVEILRFAQNDELFREILRLRSE